MSKEICGQTAKKYLESIGSRVELFKKDNTDKLWSYKLKSARRTEFAFDPNTTTGLFVWVDREPPTLDGLSDVEKISGKNVSTALDRVFSGGLHRANYKVTVRTESSLENLISYYESLIKNTEK